MLKKFIVPLMTICTLLFAVSCEEAEEISEYANWKSRNTHYVDSIADLARNGVGGWTAVKAYTMGDSLGTDGDNKYYIYVQKLEEGAGTYSPQDGDTVRVHYSGRLIPTDQNPLGLVFDKSYSSSFLNEDTDVPVLLAVDGTVVGFGTALMHMVEGDRWKVVIPQYLGYQGNKSGSIPAYSTLIFDMKLARVYRNGDDNDTNWH